MHATVSTCTILLVLKFAGECSEVWRALVSLISCIFRSLNMMHHYRVMYLVLCVIVSATSIDIVHGILSWALVCSVMSHRHIHALCTCGTGELSLCWALACSVMSHWRIHALCARGTRDVSMCWALACSVISHWHIHVLCANGTRDVSMCSALNSSVMSHWHIHALCTHGTGDVYVLSISFLCDVTLTSMHCVHMAQEMCPCAMH